MASKKQTSFKVSLEELLEAGAHFGHIVRRWNPKMKEFIWMSRDGVHVFDLAQTASRLEAACQYLFEAARDGKRILFVGTKRQAKEAVKEVAIKIGVPYVTERWLGGTLTNWGQIKNRIKHMAEMREKRAKGDFSKYTKKEQLLFDREINKLERFFGGIDKLESMPEVMFVVDTHKERVAIREAKNKGVKVVGVTDSNADPSLVDYPIPANDDAIRSIKLIVDAAAAAVEAGLKAKGK
jgi:small subunit ribosomal protein S2